MNTQSVGGQSVARLASIGVPPDVRQPQSSTSAFLASIVDCSEAALVVSPPALADANLDALVCKLAENVVLLSGYYPNTGASLAWSE